MPKNKGHRVAKTQNPFVVVAAIHCCNQDDGESNVEHHDRGMLLSQVGKFMDRVQRNGGHEVEQQDVENLRCRHVGKS